MAKNRSLRAVKYRLGDIAGVIKHRIDHGPVAEVLEVGCGFGLPMLELKRLFKGRINIVGINRSADHNRPWLAVWEGVRQLRFPPWEAPFLKWTVGFPRYVNCDASANLPFESGVFDVVYSIVSTGFFADKIRFLEEVDRVLKPEGIARIHFHHNANETGTVGGGPTPPHDNLCEIRAEDGTVIDVHEFLGSFPSLKFVSQASGKPEYLCIEKSTGGLDLGLELVESYVLTEVQPEWVGYTRSIYARR